MSLTDIKIASWGAAAMAATILAACAVGPDFHRPTEPTVALEELRPRAPAAFSTTTPDQSLVTTSEVPADWWRAFNSPPLDDAVEQALAANPDLAATRAALAAARELAAAGRGVFLPEIAAAGAVTHNKDALRTVAGTAASGDPIYTLHTGQLNLSYTFDLFGGNRRALEALVSQAEVQRFQFEAARLTVSANVVLATIQRASLVAQEGAAQKVVLAEMKALELLRRRFTGGDIAMADVIAQQAALDQARQTLPGLQKQIAQQDHILAALAGHIVAGHPPAASLVDLTLPAELPVGLPGAIVRHRPDVRAAEAAMHAASAQVGVATAAMLPNITLSASAGATAADWAGLFTPGTAFWSLAGGLSQPVFSGGALVHKKRATIATLQQAEAQYRSVVVNAFREVSDTLAALDFDARTLDAAEDGARAASESMAIVQHQLAVGAVSTLALLNAEQTHQLAESALIQARAARLADTVALFQAMGGGWWNAPQDAPAG